MKRRLLILLSICHALLPETGKAQSEWTEDDCVRYAIKHNLRIQDKELDVASAHAEVVTAYGKFLPSAQATAVWGSQFGRSIDPRTNQYTSESFSKTTVGLNLSLPVFEGFSRVHRLQFHRVNKEINVLLRQVEENNLAFEVYEAFYRYYFDMEMHRLAVEQRKLGEYYCWQMTEYVDLGMRSLSDLQEVKARLQSDLYQETVKSNSCRLSLLALKELMNIKDVDTLCVVMPDRETDIADCPLSLDALCSAAETSLPEYRIMDRREKASRRLRAAARGDLYPSVRMEFNLNTGYYDTEKAPSGGIVPFREQWSNNLSKYIGICVSLPLFNGLARLESVRKENLRLRQVRNENERRRLSLSKEIHDTYLSFRATLQEHRLAKEQLHADSITWKEGEEKWKEGMLSLFELLERRNRYMRAKAEIIRTRLQYNLKSRVIRFYQEGRFLRERMGIQSYNNDETD